MLADKVYDSVSLASSFLAACAFFLSFSLRSPRENPPSDKRFCESLSTEITADSAVRVRRMTRCCRFLDDDAIEKKKEKIDERTYTTRRRDVERGEVTILIFDTR